jgi:hypothetical protein
MQPVMSMQLDVTRSGARSTSDFAPKQEYTVHFHAMPTDRRADGHIQFGFFTPAKGAKQSHFGGQIELEKFEELALLMLKAHPQAAIKAFGAALQQIEMPEG